MQIVIMLAIGGAAGAASFTHVHNVAASHGQPGWLAWADAIVLELMSIASGLELRRRKRVGRPVLFPAAVLVVAVVLSLAAQVVEAERSVIGWIAAALPAAGFLAMVKIALGRTGAAPAALQHRRGAVLDEGSSSRTDGDRPGRSPDGRPPPSADRQAEHDADEDAAAEAAYLRDLVPAALAASVELAGQGRPLSREALADVLRRQGHAMSNARASALVKLVKQHSSTTMHTVIPVSATDMEVSDALGHAAPGQQVLPGGVRDRGPP